MTAGRQPIFAVGHDPGLAAVGTGHTVVGLPVADVDQRPSGSGDHSRDATMGDDAIAAPAAVNRVAAVATVDRVVAWTAGDQVVARAAEDQVIASATEDLLVTTIPWIRSGPLPP